MLSAKDGALSPILRLVTGGFFYHLSWRYFCRKLPKSSHFSLTSAVNASRLPGSAKQFVFDFGHRQSRRSFALKFLAELSPSARMPPLILSRGFKNMIARFFGQFKMFGHYAPKLLSSHSR